MKGIFYKFISLLLIVLGTVGYFVIRWGYQFVTIRKETNMVLFTPLSVGSALIAAFIAIVYVAFFWRRTK